MSGFQFGVGLNGPWVDVGFGQLNVANEEFTEILKGQGVVIDWCHRADEDEDMIGGAL